MAGRNKAGSTVLSKRKSVKCCDLSELTKAEIEWARMYCATLRATGHSWRYMSDTVNIQGKLIREWADDPEWQAMVTKVAEDHLAGAIQHLNRAGVDLAEMLLEAARGFEDEGTKLKAILAALDRVGISAVSKSESKVTKNELVEHGVMEGFFDKFEALPLETQKEVAKLMGEVDQLVSEARHSE